MRVIGLLLVLGGCAAERAMSPDAPVLPDAAAQTTQPKGCEQTITLVGAITPAPQTIGPRAIDSTGFNVCLDLDATALGRAHFMGGTSWEPSLASSFVATLQRTDGTTIQEGWDVTVDDTPPRTMVNLEWSPPVGQVTHTVLWVRARGATATTTVDMALFDPLE